MRIFESRVQLLKYKVLKEIAERINLVLNPILQTDSIIEILEIVCDETL